MSAREALQAYLERVERRVRVGTLARGAAILTASALTATIILVLAANALAFSQGSVTAARLLLVCAIAAAATFGLALPMWRLSRGRAVSKAESTFPQFQQRLVTFVEREGDDPFIDLLAADALEIAETTEPATLEPNGRLLALTGAGVLSITVLLWLIAAKPGFVGYGANLLWTGSPAAAEPIK